MNLGDKSDCMILASLRLSSDVTFNSPISITISRTMPSNVRCDNMSGHGLTSPGFTPVELNFNPETRRSFGSQKFTQTYLDNPKHLRNHNVKKENVIVDSICFIVSVC